MWVVRQDLVPERLGMPALLDRGGIQASDESQLVLQSITSIVARLFARLPGATENSLASTAYGRTAMLSSIAPECRRLRRSHTVLPHTAIASPALVQIKGTCTLEATVSDDDGFSPGSLREPTALGDFRKRPGDSTLFPEAPSNPLALPLQFCPTP